MEKSVFPIDWSKLVVEEIQAKDLFKNLQNDKCNREFLSNHIDERLELWGYYEAMDSYTNALMQNCEFKENDFTISLGHMWWSDFSSHVPKGKTFKQGECVRIIGEIYQYKNNDPEYTIERTYGARVIEIL